LACQGEKCDYVKCLSSVTMTYAAAADDDDCVERFQQDAASSRKTTVTAPSTEHVRNYLDPIQIPNPNRSLSPLKQKYNYLS